MKRIVTACILFVVLASPVFAVYHDEKPVGSAEIVEHGKLLHKFVQDNGYGGWSHTELMIVYQQKYYICLIDRNILHCEEKKVYEPTMLGDK